MEEKLKQLLIDAGVVREGAVPSTVIYAALYESDIAELAIKAFNMGRDSGLVDGRDRIDDDRNNNRGRWYSPMSDPDAHYGKGGW